MKLPKFSIIIITKNEEKNIKLLLSDIQKQILQPSEVIIADADSTDDTRKIAKEFGAKVVEGGMPGKGRNLGAQAATTGVFIFLDADVRLPSPSFLNDVVKEFCSKQLDVAGIDLYPMTDKWFDHFAHTRYNKAVRRMKKRWPHSAGSFIMITKKRHQQIHGFDESVLFGEDRDYVYRAGKGHAFDVLDADALPVSIRRLERDGRWPTYARTLLSELHYRILGPIKHDGFKYRFGHDKE